jgi:hypothetical protein
MTRGSFLFISYRSERSCTSLYFANKNFIFYICSRRSEFKIYDSSNELITIKSCFFLFAVDILTCDALTQSISLAFSERDDSNMYSESVLLLVLSSDVTPTLGLGLLKFYCVINLFECEFTF